MIISKVRTTMFALGLGATLLTGACMRTEPVGGSANGDPCGAMETPSPEVIRSVDLVLIDRSGSTQADSDGYVPAWADGLKGLIPIESGADYRVAPFAGGRFVSWPTEGKLVPTLTGTASHRAPIVAGIRKCIGVTIDKAVLPPKSKGGSDIIAAMATAADRLGISQAEAEPSKAVKKRLFVATDGRATVGCAKPSSGHHLTRGVINRTLSACKNSDELPSLKGVSITFVGLGTSSSSVAAVLPHEGGLLTELWLSLCGAMKADCKAVPIGASHQVTPAPSTSTH